VNVGLAAEAGLMVTVTVAIVDVTAWALTVWAPTALWRLSPRCPWIERVPPDDDGGGVDVVATVVGELAGEVELDPTVVVPAVEVPAVVVVGFRIAW
jgi:hypothetical protein